MPETYTHLFSTCAFAEEVWEAVSPVLNALRFPMREFDRTPARLLGDLSQLDTEWMATLQWGGAEAEKPSRRKQLHYFRTMWTEIRSTVLKAIWDARCKFLLGGGGVANGG